jgi:hypothetical protein
MAERRPAIDRRAPWWGVALLVALAPLILAVLLLRVAWSLCLHVVAWCWWLPHGRDTLIVYSDSPVWQGHIEQRILPCVRARAVVLNWSARARWRFGLAPILARHFGGARAFNPLAVVFRPLRRARVFRFWQPFRDWKHGRGESLDRLESELFAYLGIPDRDRAA